MVRWRGKVATNVGMAILAAVGTALVPPGAPFFVGALTVHTGLTASTLAKRKRRLAQGG